jgi:hypothetical protein
MVCSALVERMDGSRDLWIDGLSGQGAGGVVDLVVHGTRP